MSFELYNVPINHLSREELDRILRSWINGSEQKMIVTPNPEMLLLARKNKEFLHILRQSDLSLPDGVGLRYAVAALTDERLKFRHTGVDTVEHLAKICENSGKTFVLIGGRKGIGKKSAQNLRKIFPDLEAIGIDPGFIKDREGELILDKSILDEILRLKPTVIAVALGAGKQEKFIVQYLKSMPSVRVAIGIGGAFDMIGGYVSRAPSWMRQSGLEWLWRVLQEPSRFKRIWQASVVFSTLVAYDSLRNKRIGKAVRGVLPEIVKQLTRR